MTTSDLKKRLIDKIRKTNDSAILEDIYGLLDMETEDSEIYKLSDEQKNVIHKAQEQIKKGKLPDR